MIRLEGVSKRYRNGHHGLLEVSLTVHRGEFVFLVGPSGAGKSTLIRLLYGEDRATSGNVLIDQFRLEKMTMRQLPRLRRQLGIVFQDVKLLPTRTVFQNVAFAMEVIGASKKDIARRVPQVLDLVGLRGRKDNFPDQLSGGEQQRVGIARALVNQPTYILADEPTGNLDPETGAGIMRLFQEINRRGATVLMATHARELVNQLHKRVVALEDGRIVRDEARGAYGYDA